MGNAQNKHALLGKLLRLNVDGASGYTIPTDNPFARDTSGAPEAWSYGLRNPWRLSFGPRNRAPYIRPAGPRLYAEAAASSTAHLPRQALDFRRERLGGGPAFPAPAR